jgi:hypothetical protein
MPQTPKAYDEIETNVQKDEPLAFLRIVRHAMEHQSAFFWRSLTGIPRKIEKAAHGGLF